MAQTIKTSLRYGSHLPVLVRAAFNTNGDILELGAGTYSTPFLHAISVVQKRRVMTLENFKNWFGMFAVYNDIEKNGNHSVQFVEDWNKVDQKIWDWEWDVVLVDQTPDSDRKEAVKKLAGRAKLIIIHDSNGRYEKQYHYSEIFPLFRYRFDFTEVEPSTTVLSNFIDVTNFI